MLDIPYMTQNTNSCIDVIFLYPIDGFYHISHTMTISQIAHRLVELVRAGKDSQAHEELYSADVVSVEVNNANTPDAVWLDGIKQKWEMRATMLEEFHGITVSEPIIADDYFAVTYTMDITYKGAPRSTESELAVYRVKDGKIVREEFFYEMPDMG